ncbi:MAG: sigma-70 family RNA polymerase sigma factor [Alphaproteobacteria bacterium]
MLHESALRDVDEEFRRGLLELIPFLRAFSRSLCGDRDLADDLAQEALTKAWQSRDTFRAGSNLKAWLFTILRNQFYSDRRRAWRQAPWDESAAERVPAPGSVQGWAMQLSDTARALRQLPNEQREALILVGAGGFSYEDAARICNCAVGTVKSRVARARKALIASLEGKGALPLPSGADRAQGDATHEIMSQLDHLAPLDTRNNLSKRRGRR